jgi:hypothetical protein
METFEEIPPLIDSPIKVAFTLHPPGLFSSQIEKYLRIKSTSHLFDFLVKAFLALNIVFSDLECGTAIHHSVHAHLLQSWRQ